MRKVACILLPLLAVRTCAAQSPVPLISTALNCGRAGTAGSLPDGTDLQRHDIDLAQYPNAMCNDGTGAAFYFRPHNGDGFADRWLIQFQGGGLCGSPADCAKRWCSVDTAFSSIGMSTSRAPRMGTSDAGISERRADNPFANWNQVLVKYCSSDLWSGTAKNLIVEAADPVTREPKVMRIHFLGSRIVDAVIATLRRQGGRTVRFTLGGANTELPNLDNAGTVVIAGASAGSGGLVRNLDRLTDALRRTNPRAVVRGLHDSGFPPDASKLDASTTVYCREAGLCSYSQIEEFEEQDGQEALWRSRVDDSCREWHRKNEPGSEYVCNDNFHALTNHLTTPVFVRMGQTDELHSRTMIQLGYTVPGQGLIDVNGFARLVREQMAGLADLKATAHEGTDISVAPGGFSPTCKEHEVLRGNPEIFNVRIREAGRDYRMFDIIGNWIEGRQPSILVSQPNASVCPE
ncbi:MAG: hypothetical protein FJW39_29105 [Acidobacteria bacterium]|nr:hypothetical protein [Acidobacteriota bacterium]